MASHARLSASLLASLHGQAGLHIYMEQLLDYVSGLRIQGLRLGFLHASEIGVSRVEG